jgi:serine/threonine protein kinase
MNAPETARCPHCFGATRATPCPHCGWQPGQDNPPPALALGRVLDGRYRVGRVLGHGGFGITYLAWDDNLHLRLAIKEYFPRDSAGRGTDGVSLAVYSGPAGDQFTYGLDRFLEEARTLAHFDQHPGIVTVKNFFRAYGTGYCVMDYVEGITLRQYLDQQPGGRIVIEDALKLLMPVMDALRAVHKEGLLHRDIAPDNIYLSQDGRIKLLDFGAARFAASEHSKSLSIILKPGYAPEEQYRTKGQQGPWTDVYGLAATLYRAITGQVPPESLDRLDQDDLVPPSRLGMAITPSQEATLLKALAVKAGQRFQNLAKLQQAWRAGGVADAPQSAGEPSGPVRAEESIAPAAKPKPWAKTAMVLALVTLLILSATVAWVLVPWSETTQPTPPLAGGASAPTGGASPNERYRFVGKDQEIVEDTRTHLQWQRCSLGQTWNGGSCAGEAIRYKWDEARRIAPAGWRLPTKEELASLVYCSSGEPTYWKTVSSACQNAHSKPTIWSAAFPNTPESWFWSSSPSTNSADFAWYVHFGDGYVGSYFKSYAFYVRPVRGGIFEPDPATPTSANPPLAPAPPVQGKDPEPAVEPSGVSPNPPAKAPAPPPAQTAEPPPTVPQAPVGDQHEPGTTPQPDLAPAPPAPGGKAPLYFAAELPPTANIPPEAPLCYKYLVAGPEEQLRKLKTKYPGLYQDKISTNPDGGKNLVAKRKDETGKEITYFYSTSPGVCNDYQKDRLQTSAKPDDRGSANTASPPGGGTAPTGGASPNERYRFLGKDQEIVEDTRTRLQWQRCSLGKTWNGASCAGEATKYPWDKAQRIAPAGWRLPTKDELASLVYCSSGQPAYWKTASGACEGAYSKPTIWSAAFPNTPESQFWSTSPTAGYAGSAWGVYFSNGSVNYYYKDYAKSVRLVRGGQ